MRNTSALRKAIGINPIGIKHWYARLRNFGKVAPSLFTDGRQRARIIICAIAIDRSILSPNGC